MSYPGQFIRLCNLLTYVSLLSGMLAIIAAKDFRSWEIAGLLIAVAAFADTFDGKFARRFSRTERERLFGAQLDSLVDAVSFGIVPVICLDSLLQFGSSSVRVTWLIAAFVYLLSVVTRLGYYNLQSDADRRFVGLPTTLAALVWSTLFLLHPPPLLSALLLVCIGVAMVSTLPVSRPRGVTMWAYMVWFFVVFASYGVRLAKGAY